VSDLPTGVVTFLFTDIEGSTRLWDQYPYTMPAALTRHDSILSQAIAEHDGVVFRTVGDAFFAAFAEALSAVLAALQAQLALYTEPWDTIDAMRVRMAIHTNTVDLRDDGYFGPPLNRVARMLAAAHGGQTLICHTTQEQVRERLPSSVTLRDLGEHQLRDLTQPEHIFELVADGLPADFPPLKTVTAQATDHAVLMAAETPAPEAYISRQHKLPGMPSIDFDAILKKERERQRKTRKTRKGKTKNDGGLF
jgi:class 3 adenylate cyclase